MSKWEIIMMLINDKHGHLHGHSVQVDIDGDNRVVVTRNNRA